MSVLLIRSIWAYNKSVDVLAYFFVLSLFWLGIAFMGSAAFASTATELLTSNSIYEEAVNLPSYDPNNAAMMLIKTDGDWLHINDEGKRFFFVEPGDYSASNALKHINLRASGTKDARRYIILKNGNNLHPSKLDKSQLARVIFFLYEADYWVIDRMAFWDYSGTSPLNMVNRSDHTIFNRMYIENINSTSFYILPDSDYTTVQNSRIHRDEIGYYNDRPGIALFSNGSNTVPQLAPVAITNTKILNNEVYNFNDAFQAVAQPATHKDVNFEGTIVDSNHFYFDSTVYTNCAGVHDPNGSCMLAENSIDVKHGSENPQNPMIFTNNILWGNKDADENHLGGTGRNNLSANGEAMVIHNDVKNTHVANNLLFDSLNGFSIAAKHAEGSYSAEDLRLYNNILDDITSYNVLAAEAKDLKIEGNLFKNGGGFNGRPPLYFYNDLDTSFKDNYFVSSFGNGPLVQNSNFDIENNVYFLSNPGNLQHSSDIVLTNNPTNQYADIQFTTDQYTSTPRSITKTKIVRPNSDITHYLLVASHGVGGLINVEAAGVNRHIVNSTTTIHAQAIAGYRFDHWSGDVNGTSQSIEVLVDSNKSAIANFVLSSDSGNQNPPVLGSIGTKSGQQDSPISINLSASDPDSDAILFSSNNLPDFLTLTNNYDGSASITGMPNQNDVGSYSITVIASDGAYNDSETFSLTVSGTSAGVYNLITNSSVGGSVTSGGQYASGALVQVTASTNEGYVFSGWTGDSTSLQSTIEINMTSNHTVTANFSLASSGGVLAKWIFDNDNETSVIDSSGKSNGGTLSASTPYQTGIDGSGVLLNDAYATANNQHNLGEFTFNLWFKRQGEAKNNDYHTLVSGLGHVKSSADGYVLVKSDGSDVSFVMRSGSNNDGIGVSSDSVSFADNAWHMVTAVRDSSQLHLYIDGELKGSRAYTATALSQQANDFRIGAWRSLSTLYQANGLFDELSLYDEALDATSILQFYTEFSATPTFTLSTESTTGGNVTTGGLYPIDAIIQLTATASTGYSFSHWSGDASGADATINISMNSNKSVIAHFEPKQYTLSTVAGAGGSVTAGGSYDYNSTVQLTAIANTGYIFSHWEGDSTETNAVINIAMGTNKTVTAIFNLIPVNPPIAGDLSKWSFNNDTVNTVADSTGKGNTGTIAGAASYQTGIEGTGLLLNGAYVTANTQHNLGEFTFNLWFKRQGEAKNNDYHTLVSGLAHVKSSADGYILVKSDGSDVSFVMRSGSNNEGIGVTSDSVSFADNAWHMVTAVRDSSQLHLYIDGELKDSRTYSATALPQLVNDFRIGAWRSISTLYQSNGLFDQLGVYGEALSATDIQQLYTRDSTPDSDNDGLTNEQEDLLNTDKNNSDSDGDGIPDGVEVGDPNNPTNTDGDNEINALDTDDDNDGKLTADEDENLDGDNNPSTNPTDKDGDNIPDYLDANDSIDTYVKINVRVWLQGPYQISTGLMNDSLRIKQLIPTAQPYTELGFSHSGSEQIESGLLTALEGNRAIVDWVVVELRDKQQPDNIVASRALLLQRDGNINTGQFLVEGEVVSINEAETTIRFDVPADNYFVTVRHRNHLSVMTQSALALTDTPRLIDFSDSNTAVFGQYSRHIMGSVALLYAGDINLDGNLIFDGPNNDKAVLLAGVLTAQNNPTYSANYIHSGYYLSDVNLDGVTIYSGANNDINVLFGNILLHQGNETSSGNYIVGGHLAHAK